ncbi:MAG: VWA domain-containing protein [Chitinophagaceae bacterium]|nr:VWA domain-containing protein [Chitinophagaceae bacterium]
MRNLLPGAALLLLMTFTACHQTARDHKQDAAKKPVVTEKKVFERPDEASVPPAPGELKKSENTYTIQEVTLNGSADESIAEPVQDKEVLLAPNTVSDFNTEGYGHIVENKFQTPQTDPLSTFSIDVDEASYSNVRRFIESGSVPPAGAVRIEEMVNYFDYDYPQPQNNQPFEVITEMGDCPWNTSHKLVHIGLQGKTIPLDNLPASNIVFLVDVSGSMDEPNKLPLVQDAMKLLTDQLREKDRVAIVVYAGNAGLVLPSTSGAFKTTIKNAISELEAGGSTAGGEGIQLAYKVARENFIAKGNNRIILATDGDFNVGASSDDELVRMIEKERKSGVFLSVLGFGTGNYQDNKMQQLADKGNGNHSYIDQISEARKVLISEFGSTLFTIAKDVKIQVEFNPSKVQAYRLVGYENRMLAAEDFNDDTKDAGELGSGHTVTALYEIIPVGVADSFVRKVDNLKYQQPKSLNVFAESDEVMTIKLRYKEPDGETSQLITKTLRDIPASQQKTSDNFRFSAAVAEFGLLLRNSEYKQNGTMNQVISLAETAKGQDKMGYRKEFISLVKTATSLAVH